MVIEYCVGQILSLSERKCNIWEVVIQADHLGDLSKTVETSDWGWSLWNEYGDSL